MIYSKYQENIFDAVLNTNSNIAINATAGSGKTSTIVEAARRISIKYPYKSILFNAFNKSIVEELKTRLPSTIECSTIHSLGMRSLMKYFRTQLVVNQFKSFKFADYILKDANIGNKKEVYKFTMQDIIDLVRMTLVEHTESAIEELCSYYDITITNGEINHSIELLNHLENYNKSLNKNNNLIDFTDMVYIPATNNDIKLKQYDIVLVDELQDFNKIQNKFVEKLIKPGGRIIGVGDKHQCQPEGTKILMSDRSFKNIEDLKIGDKIISYKQFGDYFCGHGSKSINAKKSEVKEILKREFEGKLICISSNNRISKYTSNHKCFVTFNKNEEYSHCLYLMKKGNFFRIGISPLWSKKSIGVWRFTHRLIGEKCDEAWILNIYKKRHDAWLDEQYYSYEYGIPQMVWNNRNYINKSQKLFDDFYNRFDSNKQLQRVNSLLDFFNKDINFPFWNKNKLNYFSRTKKQIIQASNLFKDIMNVIHYSEKRTTVHNKRQGEILKIDNVWTENYKGYVYSLDVDETKTYVADNIMTHNSIYAFAGADSDSFLSFENRPNTIKLPLNICYRCAKEIVKNAQTVNSEIEAYENQEQGEVRIGNVEEITSNDMVVCRNVRPLVALYFKLLEMDKKCFIKGRDIEKGLIALYNKVKDFDKYEAKLQLDDKLEKLELDLLNKGVKKPREHIKYLNLREKIIIIEIISSKVKFMFEVEKKIHELFTDRKDAISLMTIHKSKGLESDRVFFIEKFDNNKLIPSKYANKSWELIQENNLLFVALSRAKKSLIYINLIE